MMLQGLVALTPVHQENEQISRGNRAVAVEISWAIVAVSARPPTGEEDECNDRSALRRWALLSPIV